MNLTNLKIGEIGVVQFIYGCNSFRLRMKELGIIEGIEIKVLTSKSDYGPVLVCVNNINKFGIGRGAANKILIK